MEEFTWNVDRDEELCERFFFHINASEMDREAFDTVVSQFTEELRLTREIWQFERAPENEGKEYCEENEDIPVGIISTEPYYNSDEEWPDDLPDDAAYQPPEHDEDEDEDGAVITINAHSCMEAARIFCKVLQNIDFPEALSATGTCILQSFSFQLEYTPEKSRLLVTRMYDATIAQSLLEEEDGKKIDMESIPLDDPDVFNYINEEGCGENSRASKIEFVNYVKKHPVTSMDELARAIYCGCNGMTYDSFRTAARVFAENLYQYAYLKLYYNFMPDLEELEYDVDPNF